MNRVEIPVRVRTCGFGLSLALLIALLAFAAETRAGSQSLTLQPGWNSIFLEVEPDNPAPAAVFGGVAGIQEVWSFFPKATPIEFLSDPSTGLWNIPGWNVWLAPGQPDAAALSNLFAINGNRAYLVKVGGSAAVPLTVTGRDEFRNVEWKPDSFTLTGLPVDASTTVRAGDWFFNSTAHKGQPRFRLTSAGTWLPLTDGAALARGQAYWFFTKGASSFSSPLAIEFGGGNVLDFGPTIESQQVTLFNRSVTTMTVTFAASGGFPLVYEEVPENATGPEWRSFATFTRSIPAGGSVTLRLGVRRAQMTGDEANGILTVSAQGAALKLPLVARSSTAPVAGNLTAGSPRGKMSMLTTATSTSPNAGLWVGTATLNAVSEANSADPAVPKSTPAEFTLRLLLHVDNTGKARLLKEVLLMRKRTTDPADTPPLVLVSDPARIPDYDAAAQRDGSPFSYRLSTIGFDFAGTEALLGGTFGSQLKVQLKAGRDLPTNPLKHRYHPDHDDKDPNFLPLGNNLPPDRQEVWEVRRSIQLDFAAPASGDNDPAAGYSERRGTYRESVAGLHKHDLETSGSFVLRRVSTLSELNPAP